MRQDRKRNKNIEAWIDYIPSRGARHREGDTWIPLDASFKLYDYTQGIDLASAVPFDAEGFAETLVASATINEEQGYVTGVDSAYIEQVMGEYQTQVSDYITANHPDATVGDVLGTKEIVAQEFPYLLGTLPYRLKVVGARYAEMSDAYRHRITFRLSAENVLYDTGPIDMTKSLPELAGKKITLSYSPATQADEDLINSYLPEPHPDGTPIDPSELPDSLPAYLINLKPELMIDGQVVATGGAVTMGRLERFEMAFSQPNMSQDVITNMVEAGEYLGIALDLGRISKEQMEAIQARLEATRAKLEAEDYEGLTKDNILGELLYTTAMTYNAELDAHDSTQAKSIGVKFVRLPSEAIFKTSLETETSFGVPVTVSAGGLSMDVDRIINVATALNGSKDKRLQFLSNAGMTSSALEHIIPENLFNTKNNPAKGISAVKAIQIASIQNIPVYTVTKNNIGTVIPQLQLDSSIINDINNAVNAGNEVTVSKTNINYNGWVGCGYIIFNPSTGSGAYMISGDENGSWLALLFFSTFLLGIVLGIMFTGPLALILINIFISFVQVFGSYVIKKSLGEEAKLSSKEGLLAVLDIIIQITLGAVSREAFVAKTSFMFLKINIFAGMMDMFIFVI